MSAGKKFCCIHRIVKLLNKLTECIHIFLVLPELTKMPLPGNGSSFCHRRLKYWVSSSFSLGRNGSGGRGKELDGFVTVT